MSAVLSLWFSVVLLLLCGSSEGLKNITAKPGEKVTAEPGENVTLTCKDEKNDGVNVLEWIIEDFEEKIVFVFRDGRPSPSVTHESFRNRMFLKDSEMKDGDLSVVLKNVMINDTGTYKCKVIYIEGDPLKLISIIHLSVVPPGDPSPGDPSPDIQNITCEPGQNVTLMCRDPEKKMTTLLEWSREDSENEIVFVFRDGRPFPARQHESFRNRVFLNDSQMKDGDLSVVLKNVTISDTGTYQCKARHENDPQREVKLISSIHLSVVPPGQQGGLGGDKKGKKEDGGREGGGLSPGGITGIVLAVLLLVVVFLVGLWIYRRRRGPNQRRLNGII